LIAGGTDILPWARQGRAGDVHLDTLIDISSLTELRGVALREGTLQVGAATPIADFIRDPLLREHAPVLSRCAVWFADDQIRAQATVGGNLINASPAGDSQPALLLHDCRVTLSTLQNHQLIERQMPLADFILGPSRTACQPDEVLVKIEMDSLKGYGCAFEKVGHRRSLVISTVCLAVAVKVNWSSKKIQDFRLAIGAVGPVPTRITEIEKFLVGKEPDAKLLRDAAQMVAEHVQSRSRQEYRREVLVNFAERGAVEALSRAGVPIERMAKELS
jgi:CO/xanthine dehydrogenase FAD-binding subunit